MNQTETAFATSIVGVESEVERLTDEVKILTQTLDDVMKSQALLIEAMQGLSRYVEVLESRLTRVENETSSESGLN